MFLTGVMQTFVLVIIHTIFFVGMRMICNLYDIHSVAYSTVSLVMASLTLSLIAGPGKYSAESLKAKESWFYGFSLILIYIFQMNLMRYVSGTELTIIVNLSIPISFVFARIFLKRKSSKIEVISVSLVAIAVCSLFSLQKAEHLTYIISLSFAVGISNTLIVMFAEVHKQSKKANQEGDFKDKIRVIAFVSFISAILFCLFALGLSFIKTYYFDNEMLSFIPKLDSFRHFPSIISGIIVGTFFAPLNRYLKWSATYKIKSEYVISVMAFMSLLAFLSEYFLLNHPAFAINKYVFEGERGIILFTIVIISTIGAGLPVFIKIWQEKHPVKAVDSN